MGDSMDVKTGGGGKPERYDENTGKYVDSNGGSQKYKAEVKLSDEDIIKAITSGEYGDEILNIWNVLDDSEKQEFLQDLRSDLSDFNTKQDLAKRYNPMTLEQFNQWGRESESNCEKDDLSAFNSKYRGAGDLSFEFNKAFRLGFDKFYEKQPQFKTSSYLSPEAITEQARKFDRLTRSFKTPQDVSVYRYVDTNYLVSQFKYYFNDAIKVNPGTQDTYWYDTIDKSVPLKTIYECLKNSIGDVILPDKAFTSFSCVEGQTHMGRHKNDDFKPIKLVYDVDKGQNCFISTYGYESEGMFPRETSYYVKDVKMVNQDGQERIFIYYGIR